MASTILERVDNKYVCTISLNNVEIRVSNDVDSNRPETATVNIWRITPHQQQPDEQTDYLKPPHGPQHGPPQKPPLKHSCGSCKNKLPVTDQAGLVDQHSLAARVSSNWRTRLGNIYRMRQRSMLQVAAMNSRPVTCSECEHLTRYYGTYWCGTSYIKRLTTWLINWLRGDSPREYIGCGCNLNIKWFMHSTPQALIYKLYLFGLKMCGDDTPDINLIRKANKKTGCPLGLWQDQPRSFNPMLTA